MGSRTVVLVGEGSVGRKEAGCVGGGEGRGGGVPVGPVEGFDCFGVEVFDGLFVAAADAVFGAGVAVEGVDCFGNAHLGGGHGCGGRRGG